MPGQLARLPASPSTGDFGQDLFELFAKALTPDPILDCSRVPVSREQGVKTPDFTIGLKCKCSSLAVEVKTMEARKTEKEYAAGKVPVMDNMEHVEKLRYLIGDANEQLIGQQRPGVLVVMTGPDDRACLPLGTGLAAIDMAMKGNHVCNIVVPKDSRAETQFSHWSRDEAGARTKQGLNPAIGAVMLLDRQWHSGDLWELNLVGLRNEHAAFPVCDHLEHESIYLSEPS